MNRSLSTLCCVLPVVVAFAGCHRHRQPSRDFTEASAQFNQLYAQDLDEAFLDPQMNAIEAQLGKVPPDSLDAESAQALVHRIQEGRTRMQALEAEREKARLVAQAPTPNFAFNDRPAAKPETRSAPSVNDAGLSLEPTAGMPMKDFLQRFGDCFEQGGPINVPTYGMRDTWVLKDLLDCRDHHPVFVQSIVVSDGVSIMGIFPKSAIVRTPVQDAGTP